MADSFAKEKQINRNFSSINVDPTVSSTDVLSSLRLLSKMNENAPESVKSAFKAVESAELKYLRSAAIALQANPALSRSVGSGLSGVMSLCALMKARNADRIANTFIDTALDEFEETNLKNSVAKVGGASKSAIE